MYISSSFLKFWVSRFYIDFGGAYIIQIVASLSLSNSLYSCTWFKMSLLMCDNWDENSDSLRSDWLEIFLFIHSCFWVSLSVVLGEAETTAWIPNYSVLAQSLVMVLTDHLWTFCLSFWTKSLPQVTLRLFLQFKGN